MVRAQTTVRVCGRFPKDLHSRRMHAWGAIGRTGRRDANADKVELILMFGKIDELVA